MLFFVSLVSAAEVSVIGGPAQTVSVSANGQATAQLLVANDTAVPQEITAWIVTPTDAGGAEVRLVPTMIQVQPAMTGVVPYTVEDHGGLADVEQVTVRLVAAPMPEWPLSAEMDVPEAQSLDVQVTAVVDER